MNDFSDWKQDDRAARHGWAPGKYIARCRQEGCHAKFIGAKLAVMCADCAYALPDPTPSVPQLIHGAMWGQLAAIGVDPRTPAVKEAERVVAQAEITRLKKALELAAEQLGEWLSDNVEEGVNWEDGEPEIDNIRSGILDAIDTP